MREIKGALDELRNNTDRENEMHRPSVYWSEYIAMFDYVFSLRDEVTQKIRHHTDMLTSDHPHQYYVYTNEFKSNAVNKYISLADKMKNYIFSEPDVSGGYGFEYTYGGSSVMINNDLLRYMEIIEKLDNQKILNDKTSSILEIGGGYGGLAVQFKKNFTDLTYYIVDIPQTLYFSVSHIMNVFPESNIYIYQDGDGIVDFCKYDFVFLPPWGISAVPDNSVDITVNQASLGEMTAKQVDFYLTNIARVNKVVFLSHNRRFNNPYNLEVNDLTQKLSDLFQVRVLVNNEKTSMSVSVALKEMIKNIIIKLKLSGLVSKILNRNISLVRSDNVYIWAVCTRK